jgi:hypothetical protein
MGENAPSGAESGIALRATSSWGPFAKGTLAIGRALAPVTNAADRQFDVASAWVSPLADAQSGLAAAGSLAAVVGPGANSAGRFGARHGIRDGAGASRQLPGATQARGASRSGHRDTSARRRHGESDLRRHLPALRTEPARADQAPFRSWRRRGADPPGHPRAQCDSRRLESQSAARRQARRRSRKQFRRGFSTACRAAGIFRS